MKPNPFASLNHFTVPVAIRDISFAVSIRRDDVRSTRKRVDQKAVAEKTASVEPGRLAGSGAVDSGQCRSGPGPGRASATPRPPTRGRAGPGGGPPRAAPGPAPPGD